MSTKQATRTTNVNQVESLTLVRNLLRTAVSSICYLRNLFPEDCFQDRVVSGINIKSLLPTNTESKTLIEWLEKGVFESLRHKYLKTIIFAICDDPKADFHSFIESYEFNISYTSDGHELNLTKKTTTGGKKVQLKAQTKQEITHAMIVMIRTLITLAQTLRQIPETRHITMKLLYHDHTPADYEPEFFRAVGADEQRVYDKEFVKLKVGSIQTQYHSMDMKIRTSQEAFEYSDETQSQVVEQEPINANEKKDKKTEDTMMIDSQETQCSDSEVEVAPAQKEVEKLVHSFEQKNTISPKPKQQEQQKLSQKEHTYYKCLEYAFQENSVFISKLAKGVGISDHVAKTMILRMEKEGWITQSLSKRKGWPVVKDAKSEAKLKEVRKVLQQQKSEETSAESESENENMEENQNSQNGQNQGKDVATEKTPHKSQELEINLSGISQQSLTTSKPSQDIPSIATKNPPATPRTSKKRKRIEDQFEVSMSQDSLQRPGDLEDFDFREETSAKMSTIEHPIAQKRRRLFRDPKTTSFGTPAKK